MVKGIGLISGGLDSMLAVKVLQGQGIQVIGVSFVTPFFSSKRAERAAEILNIELRVIDISEEHLEIVKAPKYGYGKGMNPCIDCHALMFRLAGKIMESEKADFLFSGEVLGERPMSQNYQALMKVARESGYQDFIIRPLSAKLLPETPVERQGKVIREKLLDIQGRSRKRQIELAKYYGITEYPQPAGGCLLTEPGYAKKLKDLMLNNPNFGIRDVKLLQIGRHFRIKGEEKLIVGRNESENRELLSLKSDEDLIIRVRDYPSPICMIPGGTLSEESIRKASSICVRYSDAPKDKEVLVECSKDGDKFTITAKATILEEVENLGQL